MRTVSYGKNSAPSWWEPFEERRLETKREDPLARQLQHFVAVARGLEIPRVSIRDGFLNMVAVEAICRAAETGQRIKLSTLIE
jgi:predicted dehydrogenase